MQTYCPQTVAQLKALNQSKSERFANFPHYFDFALPQGWLSDLSLWCKQRGIDVDYDLIRSTCIWSYPELGKGECGPVTCCWEVYRAWQRSVGRFAPEGDNAVSA